MEHCFLAGKKINVLPRKTVAVTSTTETTGTTSTTEEKTEDKAVAEEPAAQ